MKKIIFVCSMLMWLQASSQIFQEKTTNNVLTLKRTDGTPIPQGDRGTIFDGPLETSRLDLWINHRTTFEDLMKIKATCRRMGIFLNYRNLSFDEGQKLTAIWVEYAARHGNVAVAAATELRDSTRFGVISVPTESGLQYYIGYQRR
jgi:hypothetical protein